MKWEKRTDRFEVLTVNGIKLAAGYDHYQGWCWKAWLPGQEIAVALEGDLRSSEDAKARAVAYAKGEIDLP